MNRCSDVYLIICTTKNSVNILLKICRASTALHAENKCSTYHRYACACSRNERDNFMLGIACISLMYEYVKYSMMWRVRTMF